MARNASSVTTKNNVIKSVGDIPLLEKFIEKTIEVQKAEILSKPNGGSSSIQKSDSLWKIAKKFFGDGAKFLEKIAFNKIKYPNINFGEIQAGLKFDLDLSSLTKVEKSEADVDLADIAEPGYDLDVKILADSGAPLSGVKVTLHSTPRDSITNTEGIASFKNVEAGEHKVYLAYEDYRGGGQSISLTGDTKSIEMIMQVNLKSGVSTQKVALVVGALLIIIIGLLVAVLTMKKMIVSHRKKGMQTTSTRH